MGLSDGRKRFPICLAVLIQYRSVTASHPASHVAVAITLNAKASSLISKFLMKFVTKILIVIVSAYFFNHGCINSLIH